MTTIDHRILIPVPQQVVWDYIGNLANNARWQVDCSNLSFLTTRQEGVGTRWRASSERGKEYVVEVRAWYEGLGYEYSFIDRPPFRTAMGRIRLQEIPEGTVVQWTLEYELGGVLGGVRNSLSTGRQIDSAIAQSLKKLYLTLKTDRARIIDPNPVTKSLMRDAPDAEARAQYKPRHPSHVEAKEVEAQPESAPKPETETAVAAERVVIEEPPLTEDDTRPTRAVAAVTGTPPAQELGEPAFLADVPAEPTAKADEAEPPEAVSAETAPLVGERLSHAQMIDVSAIERELDDSAQESASVTESITTSGGPIIEEPPLASSDSQGLMDTSKVSIWEVFGLPPPSEAETAPPDNPAATEVETVTALPPVTPDKSRPPATQKVKAKATAAAPEPAAAVSTAAPQAAEAIIQQPRIGLRLKLRRKLVHLRRW